MRVLLVISALALSACLPERMLRAKPVHLPEPVTNNAVARVNQTAYSFGGLLEGKTFEDITPRAFACDYGEAYCREIAPLPDGIGRLASVAQAVDGKVYIFGGYTVAEDGHEVSTPEVWIYDPEEDSYSRAADIPIPVDDSVALTYQDRYIYLVSGWSMDRNVNHIQVYDTAEDIWRAAEPWPGVPVFGHAGGIVENVMVICDGVQIVPPETPDGRRSFEDISACWRGEIQADNFLFIDWTQLENLPGKGHYRMAATGWPEQNMVVFVGGTDNPYNYNGIGYNGEPSQPSEHIWGYDIARDDFVVFEDALQATMDHRGLLQFGPDHFMIVGGMRADQRLVNWTGDIFIDVDKAR